VGSCVLPEESRLSGEPGLNVWFLGTAASVTSRSRSNAAFAVAVGAEPPRWLVDCGPGTLDRLTESDGDLAALEHVFLTHQHGDHILGLPMLNNARWDAGADGRLTIHGPGPALAALRRVTNAVFPDHRARLRRSVSFHVHSTASQVDEERVGPVVVRSVPARHSVPAVAYRFDLRGGAVAFSGDTAPSETIARLARGADLLVHDATFSGSRSAGSNQPDHSTPRDAGRIARRAGAGSLALVHLPPEASGLETDIRREASAEFQGNVVIPNDGDRMDVTTRS
jgi:ribonuclease Z